MAYNAGPTPGGKDSTLYERIALFQSELETLAHKHGLTVDFTILDHATSGRFGMHADFHATSAFLRERHPNYRSAATGETIRLEEGRS